MQYCQRARSQPTCDKLHCSNSQQLESCTQLQILNIHQQRSGFQTNREAWTQSCNPHGFLIPWAIREGLRAKHHLNGGSPALATLPRPDCGPVGHSAPV
ncbi:hypothetical protein SKAU_G00307530 [Synaphobranchus kaupii]|uniref:Uncharacterized protein n=1 Tax=Synaphobranchus kaupii TaxID=118154 RepID=A0A9Q1ER63_SYNKA|nr:hypothetical protein SKAU_G00307530 [Synaphobranchus kaupii]